MVQTKEPTSMTVMPEAANPTTTRRRWPIVLALLVAGTLVAGVFVLSDDDGASSAASTVDSFEPVVTTDLVDVETLSGTVGFDAGDSISAGASGTLTYAVEAGTVATEGEVLFEIDAEPVVLLYSDAVFYRPLGLTTETEHFAVRSQGTFTEVPAEGDVLIEGDVVARVDGDPIILLNGEIPAFRALVPPSRNVDGTTGPDVLQFEEALVRLGFDPEGDMTVDETFTSFTSGLVEDLQEAYGATVDGQVALGDLVWTTEPSVTVYEVSAAVGDRANDGSVVFTVVTDITGPEGDDVRALEMALSRAGFDPGVVDGVFDAATEAAVVDWQRSVGMEDDGVVEPSDVVLLPGPVRVSDRVAELGAVVSPNSAVLATSTDEPVVVVDLPAEDQDLLDVGDEVTVEMPDGVRVAGVVIDKATTVTQQTQPGQQATLDVVVALDDPSAGLSFDQAGVDVEVVTEERRGVMAVPVTALLALAEGGYAVEVDAGDGTTYLVAVEPGLYADGLVEVEADLLLPGQMVVAP